MWRLVYQRYFNLHQPTRPQIIIDHRFPSQLIGVGLTKKNGWDLKHLGWLVPIHFTPDGKIDGRWRRVYEGMQYLVLDPPDLIGSIEIRPKLWIPSLEVKVYENPHNFVNDSISESLQRIEEKLDDISTYGGN